MSSSWPPTWCPGTRRSRPPPPPARGAGGEPVVLDGRGAVGGIHRLVTDIARDRGAAVVEDEVQIADERPRGNDAHADEIVLGDAGLRELAVPQRLVPVRAVIWGLLE